MILNIVILLVLIIGFAIVKGFIGYTLDVRLTGKPIEKIIYLAAEAFFEVIIIFFILGSGLFQWFLGLLQQY